VTIDIEALRARNERRKQGRADAGPCTSDMDELLQAYQDARGRLAALTETHADLHESARLWADLYSASVDRANDAEARIRRVQEAPADVQRYCALRDSVDVLAGALQTLVLDCVHCREAKRSGEGEGQEGSENRCARCIRALDALRASMSS
jgi:hypothetical protein